MAFVCLSSACEPELVVGKYVAKEECKPASVPDGVAGASSEPLEIPVPWSTGFESGFCDIYRYGYCYGGAESSHVIVSEPVHVHEGKSAAEFSVTSGAPADGFQTRCVVRGTMPPDAVYGAYYYVPALAQSGVNWNLFHFRTGKPDGTPGSTHGIWDVSLGNGPDGSLHLYVLGFDGRFRTPDPAPPIPIGEWFRVQFRLKRAADATGAIALYQDGAPLYEESSLVTDDGEFGEWFVGNLVDGVMPPNSTVYVDDLSITASP